MMTFSRSKIGLEAYFQWLIRLSWSALLLTMSTCTNEVSQFAPGSGTALLSSNSTNWGQYEESMGDYPYNDIGALIAISDTTTCKHHCSQLDACVGFVYNPQLKVCVFKSKMDEFWPSADWQSFRLKTEADSNLFQEYVGLDFPENDLEVIENASIDDCKSVCGSQPECLGFVYKSDRLSCHLKSDLSFPTQATPDWLTFAKSELAIPEPQSPEIPLYQLAENTDYYGHDLEILRQATPESCRHQCDATRECVGFVWQKSQGYCHLKSEMQGPGTESFDWNSFLKPSNPTSPTEGINTPPSECVAIQVLAGEQLADLNWRMEQLIQSGYDAYLSQKEGTKIYRLRVRSTNAEIQTIAKQLADQFGYSYWFTTCD